MLGHTLGLAGNGSHEDDAAADFHALVRLLSNEELTASVDAHDTVVFLLSHILEVAEGHNAGVGATDVELAELGDDLVHELGGFLGVGHVGLDGDCVGASLHRFDFLDDFVGGLGAVGVVDGYLGASSSQFQSHLLANPTTYALLMLLSSCSND